MEVFSSPGPSAYSFTETRVAPNAIALFEVKRGYCGLRLWAEAAERGIERAAELVREAIARSQGR